MSGHQAFYCAPVEGGEDRWAEVPPLIAGSAATGEPFSPGRRHAGTRRGCLSRVALGTCELDAHRGVNPVIVFTVEPS